MTLVELLVVLAIMSLLAALLLPAFRYCLTFAQRTTCVSNMHQCTVALSLYSQDYEDSLPAFRADPLSAAQPDNLVYWHDHFCQGTRLVANQVTWASLTAPYAANNGHTADMGAVFHCPADGDRVARPATSYEFKMLLADNPNVNQVPSVSEMALLWEQWAYHIDSKLSEHDRRAAMNVIFVDNHAHWTRLSDTTTARFGTGPDLHWIFVGTTQATADYTGQDIIAQ
jgi:type II secretory pathway pseudopilin PulG